ncbi:MAG: ATP-binding cassette domain-containing protein [Clostridia bacterium]|nr:ATP-binding cassette domain-containing protein [Clostridia bacterium]
MEDRVLEIDNVSKEYRLGQLNGRTLQADVASWFARLRGLEDPNSKIGADPARIRGETLMALRDVSLNVNRGDALAIVGRNGAGKSTLLKLISRITLPTRGEIRIRGKVASLLEIGTGFHPDLTGRDNIYLNGAILGMSRAETAARMKRIIEFSEIEPFIDTPVKRYSSGMYVKLAFAVAANLSPDILICDEVLAVGDLAFQQKCLSKMRDVAQEGRAVLYVSHNLRTVAELCNRGVFLDAGRLTCDGTVDRAIELYGGTGARDLERDLNALPRPKRRGEAIRMYTMRITNTESIEYEMDGVMHFTLEGTATISEPLLRLRVTLFGSLASPAAMTQSPPFEVRAGERFKIDIAMPLDGLSPGEYGMKLSLLALTPQGKSSYYDTVEDAGKFIISEDPAVNDGFRWSVRKWGNFRMNPLQLQSQEVLP